MSFKTKHAQGRCTCGHGLETEHDGNGICQSKETYGFMSAVAGKCPCNKKEPM